MRRTTSGTLPRCVPIAQGTKTFSIDHAARSFLDQQPLGLDRGQAAVLRVDTLAILGDHDLWRWTHLWSIKAGDVFLFGDDNGAWAQRLYPPARLRFAAPYSGEA